MFEWSEKILNYLPQSVHEAIRSHPIVLFFLVSVLLPLSQKLIESNTISDIFELFERREKRKMELLESYVSLSAEGIDECVREEIKDQRDTLYFKAATGIYAEKRLRNALTTLHKTTNITWKQIHLARYHLEETNKSEETNKTVTAIFERFFSVLSTLRLYEKKSNETITVKFCPIYRWYNWFLCLIFVLSALLWFYSAILQVKNTQTLQPIFPGVFQVLLFVLLAMAANYQNRNVNAASEIAKELNRVLKNAEEFPHATG